MAAAAAAVVVTMPRRIRLSPVRHPGRLSSVPPGRLRNPENWCRYFRPNNNLAIISAHIFVDHSTRSLILAVGIRANIRVLVDWPWYLNCLCEFQITIGWSRQEWGWLVQLQREGQEGKVRGEKTWLEEARFLSDVNQGFFMV